MKSKSIVPNTLTLLNLFFGCIACVFSFWDVISGAVICLLMAALFDVLDGSIARRLNSQSDLGKKLDSLADLVSFGLTPAILLHALYLWDRVTYDNQINFEFLGLSVEFQWFPLSIIPFIITLCVAFRLAKFSSSDKQKDKFIGLPSPALALLLVPLPLLIDSHFNELTQFLGSTFTIISISIMACILVLMPVKMFKLKLSFNRSQSIEEWILYSVTLVLLFFYQLLAFPLIVFSYIMINLISNLIYKSKSIQKF